MVCAGIGSAIACLVNSAFCVRDLLPCGDGDNQSLFDFVFV
jgi:hypothetical protein